MRTLDSDWEVSSSPPGAALGPGDVETLAWTPAQIPGTAAGAVGEDPFSGRDFDAEDWWFRCRFELDADDELVTASSVTLCCEGIATLSDVYLNGELVVTGASMWTALQAEVGPRLREHNELLIACRALTPQLDRRRRPKARWRTRVVSAGGLRWLRTMIFGRSPGFAPGPAPVGPYRPIHLRATDGPRIEHLAVSSRVQAGDGLVTIRARVGSVRGPVVARLDGAAPVTLKAGPGGDLHGEVRLTDPPRWWPHTHGDPALVALSIEHEGSVLARRMVGFRELRQRGDLLRDGLSLEINGVSVFARGAVWTPPDLVTMAPRTADLRALLIRVRDAGMNMIRIPGTGAYEPAVFHDLCDELGILVWQDLMFANLDYPLDDPSFADAVTAEADEIIAGLAGRPSFTVLCGNSEVEQQPAMMGLDPALGRHSFWAETIPALALAAGADCICLPSTPWGGALPFHPDGGVTHYFGVSGYVMPVSDLRRARVAFASECLAFANVPDEVDVPVHHPHWKRGVPVTPALGGASAPDGTLTTCATRTSSRSSRSTPWRCAAMTMPAIWNWAAQPPAR